MTRFPRPGAPAMRRQVAVNYTARTDSQAGSGKGVSVDRDLVVDIYKCGGGALEVTGAVFAGEAVVVMPQLVAGLALSGMKDVTQGCGGLVCSMVANNQRDNGVCHQALDYLDFWKQAGVVVGAVIGERKQDAWGAFFAAAGDLIEGASRFAAGDFFGATEKSLSLQQHAKEFLDSIEGQGKSSEQGQTTSTNNAPADGDGDSNGYSGIGGGPGDAGSPDDGAMVA